MTGKSERWIYCIKVETVLSIHRKYVRKSIKSYSLIEKHATPITILIFYSRTRTESCVKYLIFTSPLRFTHVETDLYAHFSPFLLKFCLGLDESKTSIQFNGGRKVDKKFTSWNKLPPIRSYKHSEIEIATIKYLIWQTTTLCIDTTFQSDLRFYFCEWEWFLWI